MYYNSCNRKWMEVIVHVAGLLETLFFSIVSADKNDLNNKELMSCFGA